MTSNFSARNIQRILTDWRVLWALLLLPAALFVPALPIDETRYLSVAWEMRLRGDFLLLHLNGAPYSDKGPLLFWLINLAWFVAGLHVWIVRLGVLAASVASLVMFDRLVRRLDPDPSMGTRAASMLAGLVCFALFSIAIMFDVIVTTCVLLALHGVLELDGKRWRRGVVVFAAGIGLGLLTKGPVMLLDAGTVALLAPWWSATARENKARWYGSIVLGIVGGLLIALVWAISAYGVQGFWEAIVLRQTVGRVAKSFAHARPIWWYFMVLPPMLLPWTLALRGSWRTWRDGVTASKAARFGVAWFLPAFVVFCFFSGKQLHYLLPVLPGLVIYLAKVLQADGSKLRPRLFGALLLVCGLGLAVVPYFAAHAQEIASLARLIKAGTLTTSSLHVFAGIWPIWGVLIAALGVLLLLRAEISVAKLALASTAAAAISMLMIAQGVGPYVDVTAAAARIADYQQRGQSIAHLGWHHGLFEFPGRLTQPLEKIDYVNLHEWCAAHPNGEIVTFYTKYPITVKPDLELPYRFGRIIFWRAADLLTMPLAPVKPAVEEDDTPDD